MSERFSIQVLPRFRNSSMATRVFQAEVQPTVLSKAFSEGIDQIRAFNPFSEAKYYLPSYVSPQSNTDIFTEYAALHSPVTFRHSPFMINFMTKTASFPESIEVVDSCLSAVNSRKFDEYPRLNFCESGTFFIPCMKISC